MRFNEFQFRLIHFESKTQKNILELLARVPGAVRLATGLSWRDAISDASGQHLGKVLSSESTTCFVFFII